MLATKVEEIQNDGPRDLRSFRLFDILLSIFIVVLLVSNLVGQRSALSRSGSAGRSCCFRSRTFLATFSPRYTDTGPRGALSGSASSLRA